MAWNCASPEIWSSVVAISFSVVLGWTAVCMVVFVVNGNDVSDKVEALLSYGLSVITATGFAAYLTLSLAVSLRVLRA